MKVIICGAGQVGFSIAQYLTAQDNDVTIIDSSHDVIQRALQSMDVNAVHGHASDPDVLAQAGIQDADMILAVTHSDDVNMLACKIAHSLFNVKIKVARVRNQHYLKPEWSKLFHKDQLSIDLIISPESEIAEAMSRTLTYPGAFDVIPFADNAVQLIGARVAPGAPIMNTPVKNLQAVFPDIDMALMGTLRDDVFLAPTQDHMIQVDDKLFFVVPTESTAAMMDALGYNQQRNDSVLICGGGNIGLFLAKHINDNHPEINVTLIERSKPRAQTIAQSIPKTMILNGDALDTDLFREAGICRTEVVVTVTDDERVNILSALLAKREGAQRTMALVNTPIYASFISTLGVDAVVSPKELTVSTILQFVRQGRIRRIHSIGENIGEVIEAEVLANSAVIGMSVEEIQSKGGLQVGAIVHGGATIIPKMTTTIKTQDRVVLFVASDQVKRFEKLFAMKLGYL